MQLECADGQATNVLERAALAEVLDGQVHAEVAQRERRVEVVGAAGAELERQCDRRDLGGLQHLVDERGEIDAGQLSC